MKNTIILSAGIVGSIGIHLFGGWDAALATLVLFMLIDHISGLTAAFFGNSNKTISGGLSSSVGVKGIAKKVFILALVAVAYRLDLLFAIDTIRGAVIFAFIANEIVSITENAALMGVPIPKVLLKAIDVMRTKEETEEEITAEAEKETEMRRKTRRENGRY